MPSKLSFEFVKNYIEQNGDKMISEIYKNNLDFLEIKCGKCGEVYKQTFSSYQRGFKHRLCAVTRYKKPVILKPKICPVCEKEFQPNYSLKKFCSRDCSNDDKRTESFREKAKKNGRKGGLNSVSSQNRRSKNETYFSELCKTHFADVTENERFFDGWDADVIIHSKKIAILWNGAWHYKKITHKHSLEQVQNRDSIKNKIIEKYCYIPYTIKDMGKANKGFVEQEFQIFLFSMIEL